ncbi:MAG: phosphoglycerate dehydrogenase [Oscillospiraceae bacterium]|nr:phosphoglycerate dehydrogenase [Oscillospiraceae bacterium]
MFRIKTMNKISPLGLERFSDEVYDVSDKIEDEDAIVLRSAKLHDYDFPASLLCISRAGSGVNNIPIDRCSEKGICVFNTPGANANAVKELVICSLLLASRRIPASINWVKEVVASGTDVTTVVEKGKSEFVGPEIYKKTLGIIGLGAIGTYVANSAVSLGMDVVGYDPYLSVDSALRLDRHVKIVKNLSDLYRKADYITAHIHVTPETTKLIDEKAIAQMKRGVRVINLARGEIVDDEAMIKALDTGRVACYVTDFPNNRLMTEGRNVIAMPHLGASTPESEDNCAVMAVDEVIDYLENGNIKNSVNLPNCALDRSGVMRICIIHKNIPAMLANITGLLSKDGVNVENLTNKSRGDYAYTIVDVNVAVEQNVIDDLEALENVVRVRTIVW